MDDPDPVIDRFLDGNGTPLCQGIDVVLELGLFVLGPLALPLALLRLLVDGRPVLDAVLLAELADRHVGRDVLPLEQLVVVDGSCHRFAFSLQTTLLRQWSYSLPRSRNRSPHQEHSILSRARSSRDRRSVTRDCPRRSSRGLAMSQRNPPSPGLLRRRPLRPWPRHTASGRPAPSSGPHP